MVSNNLCILKYVPCYAWAVIQYFNNLKNWINIRSNSKKADTDESGMPNLLEVSCWKWTVHEGKMRRSLRWIHFLSTDILKRKHANVFERWEQIICQNNQNFWMEVIFSSPHIKEIKVSDASRIDFKLMKSFFACNIP